MKELRFENVLAEKDEPVEIVIAGERDGVPVEERFRCLSSPPAGSVMVLVDGGSTAQYVESVLEPGEEERFRKLLFDKGFRVSTQTLRDVYQGLLEHYTGRPIGAPRASGNGRAGTEDSSAGGSEEPVSSTESSA